jgi:hypothetical protein
VATALKNAPNSSEARYYVQDYVSGRKCFDDYTNNCTSIALSDILGKTIQHSVKVKYGLSGSFAYSAVDVAQPKTTLISYIAVGDMGASGSIKYGSYRNYTEGITVSDMYMGDYVATKLS